MKSRRERFETIAARRVQRIIDDIESLSKCSNRNNYEYDEDDVRKMVSTLKNKLKNLEDAYHQQLNRTKTDTFKF